jgi:hypothetical protein
MLQHIDVSLTNNAAYRATLRITRLQGVCFVHSNSIHLKNVPRLCDTLHSASRSTQPPFISQYGTHDVPDAVSVMIIASVLYAVSKTNFTHVPSNIIILCPALRPFSCPLRPSPSQSIAITICDFCNMQFRWVMYFEATFTFQVLFTFHMWNEWQKYLSLCHYFLCYNKVLSLLNVSLLLSFSLKNMQFQCNSKL